MKNFYINKEIINDCEDLGISVDAFYRILIDVSPDPRWMPYKDQIEAIYIRNQSTIYQKEFDILCADYPKKGETGANLQTNLDECLLQYSSLREKFSHEEILSGITAYIKSTDKKYVASLNKCLKDRLFISNSKVIINNTKTTF